MSILPTPSRLSLFKAPQEACKPNNEANQEMFVSGRLVLSLPMPQSMEVRTTEV
jgi:hypothetical protein